MRHSLSLRSAFPLDDKDHYTTWKVRTPCKVFKYFFGFFIPVLILFLPNSHKVRGKGEVKHAIDHVFFCGEGLEPMKRSSCALDRLELSDYFLPGPVLSLYNFIGSIP